MTDEADLYYSHFMKALAARIRAFRKERGLSLRDMVVKHEYHDSQWRKYEREGASNVAALLRIARVLNTTIGVLLDGLADHPSVSVAATQQRAEELDVNLPQLVQGSGEEASVKKDRRKK